MGDRKLHELAAKAAGYPWRGWTSYGNGPVAMLEEDISKQEPRLVCPSPWRPLIDDGDAMRLAVKLGMSIEVHYDESQPKPWLRVVFAGGRWEHAMVEEYARDPYAATRRAILRAAAEIGKAMK